MPTAVAPPRMSDRAYTLDASALLAFLQEEPGAEAIAEILPMAQISAVNLGEVSAKLHEYGMPEAEVNEDLASLELPVVAFDEAQALRSGALRMATRKHGLSLGDRACLAAADLTGTTALTADKSWRKIGLPIAIEEFR